MEKIFSYGKLQKDSVQIATFGRELTGMKDRLIGYTFDQEPCSIRQESSLKYTGVQSDVVEGTLFELSTIELCKVDDYKILDDYIRVKENFISGQRAWVYVSLDTQCI